MTTPIEGLLPPDELEQFRVAPGSSYDQRKAACEAHVVRREWATGPFYSLEPFDAEVGRWSRGRLAKAPPDDPRKMFEFGFDAGDQLILIRNHTEFEGRCNETFVEPKQPRWAWHYQHRDHDTPLSVRQRVFDGDRLAAIATKSRFGHSVIRYRWSDGRIRGIIRELDTGDVEQYELRYIGSLLNEIAIVRATAEPQVVYAAKPPTLKPLLAAMAQCLPEIIYQRVLDAGETRRVFCLALSYSEESPEEMALPGLSLGLESERAAWRSRGAPPAELWNPAGFATHDGHALELDADQPRELAREIARCLRAPKDYAAVVKMYVGVARALAGFDWPAALLPTEDFQILAVNVDLSDLDKNFKAILGAAAYKRLVGSGLL